jgi:NTP pyrophosphatase (non-canonical NTP hydrolase)
LGDDLKHPRLGAVLGLVEELGELVKEVMEAEIYSQDSPELRAKMGDEVADVLFSLFEVCTAYGLNLEDVYERKLQKIIAKSPEWREKYSEGLRQVRARLD